MFGLIVLAVLVVILMALLGRRENQLTTAMAELRARRELDAWVDDEVEPSPYIW